MNRKLFVMFILTIAATLAASAPAAPAAARQAILIEAEAFSDPGGWLLDQQSMDQMGSPYMLAHGLGVPVRDAVTLVKIESAGPYRLWVRTRDWVATWNAPGTPGKFKVLLNGTPASATFGTEGAAWHWQDGGLVEVAAGTLKLALHDLTGFGGRCDAIVLSANPSFTPPNELKELTPWRRQMLGVAETPREAGSYDLVVVGGGIAGATAALSAARLGLKVALVQDRPVIGGNNSAEVRMGMSGKGNLAPYPHIGDVTHELEPAQRWAPGPENTAETFEDERRLNLVKSEPNLALFMNYHVNGVETAERQVKAVVAQETRSAERIRLAGRLFADCTGDGEVGVMAGADHEITDKQHMGPSDLWNVMDTHHPAPFPRCPWALDLHDKPFPGRDSMSDGLPKGHLGLRALGQWFWETGFDWDPINDVEKMRDYNLRAMFGAWDALKNVDKVYPTHKIVWASYITGKRESVRLMGDVLLTVEDFLSGKKYDDGCFPCTWGIDLHYPEPRYEKGFEGNGFISYATGGSTPGGKNFGKYQVPYWPPYRCLYSRNIGNLFMAGRDISVTHDALGPVRVMKTTGMMGEIVGMAASLCIKTESSPRGVYEQHLPELKKLMERGTGKY